MAITDTGGGAVNNTNNAATYVTGSYTPAANDLLLSLGGISDTAIDALFTDSGGIVSTLLIGEAFTSGVPMMGYIALANTLAPAVARTMTMDVTGDNGTGAHLTVRRLQNTRAIPPFHRQFNFATGAATTTPTVVLPKACNTNNAVFGYVINAGGAGAGVTPPAGWTEILDQGHATPNMGIEYARILSGETGSTITWGSTSSTAWLAMVVEIYEVNQPPKAPRAFHHRQLMFEGST